MKLKLTNVQRWPVKDEPECAACGRPALSHANSWLLVLVEQIKKKNPKIIITGDLRLCGECFNRVTICATCNNYDEDKQVCVHYPQTVPKAPGDRCEKHYTKMSGLTLTEVQEILERKER